jgi:hypothetical protein
MNVFWTASIWTKCLFGSSLTTFVLDTFNTDLEHTRKICMQCVTHYSYSVSLGNFDMGHLHNKYRGFISRSHLLLDTTADSAFHLMDG